MDWHVRGREFPRATPGRFAVVIQNQLLDPLAMKLLDGKFKRCDQTNAPAEGDEPKFSIA